MFDFFKKKKNEEVTEEVEENLRVLSIVRKGIS